ncbi:hypothetical protein BDZ89DRAFT_1144491 [Hymenopellis radicata]|nr:hypothetical protein BDZ89DRAFT_1144491 [Hymenopellis radicata]
MCRIQRIELVSLEFKSDVFEVFDLFSHPHLHSSQPDNLAPTQHSLTNGYNPVPLRELRNGSGFAFAFVDAEPDGYEVRAHGAAAVLHACSIRSDPKTDPSHELVQHAADPGCPVTDAGASVFWVFTGYLKPGVNNYLPFQTSPSRGIPHVALTSTVMGDPPLQANEIMRWWITELSHPSRAFIGVNTLELDIEGISFDSTDALWADLDQALSNNVLAASEGPGGRCRR